MKTQGEATLHAGLAGWATATSATGMEGSNVVCTVRYDGRP